jgi:hypothetical protein
LGRSDGRAPGAFGQSKERRPVVLGNSSVAETPNPKLKTPNKSQVFNFKLARIRPGVRPRNLHGDWSLKFFWSLEFGAWGLVFFSLSIRG